MTADAKVEFGALNYALLAIYFAVMLGIGWWASRRVKTSTGYFTAEGGLNYILVGLSLLGTYLSALTMMGLPGIAFGEADFTFTVQLPFLILTAIVITGFVLPRYRESRVISVYQYLEERIHVSSRLLASTSFILFSIARMGLLLYLPALAIATVTNISTPGAIVLMGIVVTIYTVIGGIEAVIITDSIQVIVFVIAALISLAFILTGESGAQFTQVVADHHKLRVWIGGADPFKITSLWLILETVFSTIRIYGTQQDMTQRYVATDSTAKANRSVWISILGYIPLGYLFYFMGVALFVYYQIHPSAALPAKSDAIYPFFVVRELPPGIAGLVIAGIFAAAMSSISSLMNSSSTVCVEDFARRFRKKEHPDEAYLRLAKRLSLLWGILAVVMALLLKDGGDALVIWLKIMGIATNGVLGLMALAFLPFRVDKWAAALGFVGSYAVLFYLMFGTELTYLLWTVIGNLSCFLIALLLNPILQRDRPAG